MPFSSSKSKTTQNVTNIDERIAASDNAQVIDLGKGATLNVETVNDGVIGLASKALDDVLSFSEDQLGSERELVQKSLALVEKRTQSEDLSAFETLAKWGTVATVAIVAARSFGRR